MATLGYYRPAFMGALVDECLGRGLDRLSPQNLSNILWSCATLGHQDPRCARAHARKRAHGHMHSCAQARPRAPLLLAAWVLAYTALVLLTRC